jgi:predicted nucleic-acid-binding protein
MLSWCVLNKHILCKEASKQAKLEHNFKAISCHSNIFVSNENFITWCFILSRHMYCLKRLVNKLSLKTTLNLFSVVLTALPPMKTSLLGVFYCQDTYIV